MFQRRGHALSVITLIMVMRTRQFAISIFTVMDAKWANCLCDWPVVKYFFVKLLSANHLHHITTGDAIFSVINLRLYHAIIILDYIEFA